jgi:hypothetical protein
MAAYSYVMELELAAETICNTINDALRSDSGALIGRNGAIELEQMIAVDPLSLGILEKNAGVFPVAVHSIFYRWQKESIEATKSADILAAGWYEELKEAEKEAFKKWSVKSRLIPLRALEPYYVDEGLRWTRLLDGQSVAVVTSFTETAKKQVDAGLDKIWGSTMFPESIDWHWVQTGYPSSVSRGICPWPSGINNWQQAVEYVVGEVIKTGARFALIGCGGLGMPIAKMLKDRGVIAIVLGGSIQVLFGIKGKRWENHPVISKFWNDAWVWPDKDEVPGAAAAIEGGCYWG